MNSNGPRDISIVKEIVNPMLNEFDNEKLISIHCSDEIKETTFQIGSLKSLGPNGYPS